MDDKTSNIVGTLDSSSIAVKTQVNILIIVCLIDNNNLKTTNIKLVDTA